MVEILIIYLLTGMLAGFVSGLFGVGGAFTMAPALIITMTLQGIHDSHIMHLTIGTSLAVMTITSAYISVLRYRAGDLNLKLMIRFTPFIIAGALGGSLIGDALPGLVLRYVFIGFLILSIIHGLAKKSSSNKLHNGNIALMKGFWLWVYGTTAGLTGSLLGPGPAIVIAPFLRNANFPMHQIAAISSSLAGIIGLAATLGYVYGGFNESGLPTLSLGYLYLPAFAGLITGALIGSPIGVSTSHKIQDGLLHKLFIGYLSFILLVMLIQSH